MLKWLAPGAFSLLLIAAPAAARDGYGVDYGRDDNRHYRQHHRRGGAWIGPRHGHGGPHHGGHFGAGHDHFSPRGQGGHHWGW